MENHFLRSNKNGQQAVSHSELWLNCSPLGSVALHLQSENTVHFAVFYDSYFQSESARYRFTEAASIWIKFNPLYVLMLNKFKSFNMYENLSPRCGPFFSKLLNSPFFSFPALPALPAIPYCFNSLPFIDGALQIWVALPVSKSHSFQLSLFLLIYQLGADCYRRWIMLQVDGMAGNPTTSLFLMRRLMGYQLLGKTWISSGQNWPESCQGGTYTRIGSTFEDKRGWWTRMDSGSPKKYNN